MFKSAAVRTLLVYLWTLSPAFGFVSPQVGVTRETLLRFAVTASPPREIERLDVILFGVGDLRVDDHVGLQRALSQDGSTILPMMVLDPANLCKLPLAHAVDTAKMISSALSDLQDSLQQMGLDLHVSSHSMDYSLNELKKLSDNVHIHVCDLDPIDNSLGYGPFSLVMNQTNLHPWNCHLRDEPWGKIGMSDSFVDYERQIKNSAVRQPLQTPREVVQSERTGSFDLFSTVIPKWDEILQLVQGASPSLDPSRIHQEEGTGLFGTHWGGLPSHTVGETEVLQTINDYVLSCQGDDDQWVRHERYSGMVCQRKKESLEHASIAWMMKGDPSGSITPFPVTQNLIAGESMTRYLAGPLWLGTVSPRRLWHTATQVPFNLLHKSALQAMVEGREWQKLLATLPTNFDGLEYRYWRWHGFLCRYACRDLGAASADKCGLLLVHGFGASSSQWKRSIDALVESEHSTSPVFNQVLAPDLIGFGRCEKPALTYTQYLWSGFVGDFVKEIGIAQENWATFVVGGNSIGGYTSMSVAADDSVQGEGAFSSLGAPGSNRCIGLTLFNTAGRIQSSDEIMAMTASDRQVATVAQITGMDSLPACKLPPRPIARIFGNGLLAYLRPNIEQICRKVYPVNPDAADKCLCGNILRDSLDPGAVNVMISGSKLPIPRTANEILGADIGSGQDTAEGIFRGPVLVAQGMLDPLNDAKGRAAMLGSLREGITVEAINAGHCPHDEQPQESVEVLLRWAKQHLRTREPVLYKR